ncbi:hypothetical protein ACFSC4_20225 [Deinococcus malanensis]|uniref:hypothetical protein n=1 Tax=Deinococcus malanensis TaxID=1706855 RepID=UPI0016654BBA|nr:hypothetical protein [Deinococcus malanensis]
MDSDILATSSSDISADRFCGVRTFWLEKPWSFGHLGQFLATCFGHLGQFDVIRAFQDGKQAHCLMMIISFYHHFFLFNQETSTSEAAGL